MVEHSTRGLELVSTEAEPVPERDHDFVQSLERGLSVLRCFSAEHPQLTLSEVARLTGLTRATSRRLLLTFERLGYMRNDGRLFELTPLVLDLGYAYISSCKLPDLVQPDMEELSERCNESVSASVLDGDEIVYIARVPTKRIMTIALSLGSRLPAAITSMGRVLLADLPDDELVARLSAMEISRRTEKTQVEPRHLADVIRRVRRPGLGTRRPRARRRSSLDRGASARPLWAGHRGDQRLDSRRPSEPRSSSRGPMLDALLEAVSSINVRLSKR